MSCKMNCLVVGFLLLVSYGVLDRVASGYPVYEYPPDSGRLYRTKAGLWTTYTEELQYNPADMSDLVNAYRRARELAKDLSIFKLWTSGACGESSQRLGKELAKILPEDWRITQMWSLDGWYDVKNGGTGHAVTMLSSPNGGYYLMDVYSGNVEIAEMMPEPNHYNTYIPMPNDVDNLGAFSILQLFMGNTWLRFVPATGGIDLKGEQAVRIKNKTTHEVSVRSSWDPNDKSGPTGALTQRYVTGAEKLSYVVMFENLPTATAPAQEVVIMDELDLTKFDADTLELGAISFGSYRVTPPPGAKQFATEVDLRPSTDLVVRIVASLDTESKPNVGLLTWRLSSLDPNTGEPPADPLAGFLPPNTDPPAGEGNVAFSVGVKSELPTGTEVSNKATIIFDLNPPIDTPTWTNTLDKDKPSSQVNALPSTTGSRSFDVAWEGSDSGGSGIRKYSIFVSDNGGDYILWQIDTTATSARYTGKFGHTYRFYSIATDQVGNAESPPTTPDATTTIAGCVGSLTRRTGEESQPIPSVTFTLSRVTGSPVQLQTVTDPQGSFSIAELPDGVFNLKSSAFAVPPGQHTITLDLQFFGTNTAAATAELLGVFKGNKRAKFVNGRASFNIKVLSKKPVSLRLAASRLAAKDTSLANPDLEGTIVLQGYLQGNPSGSEVPVRTQVTVTEGKNKAGVAPTDAQGSFRFADLPTGDATVVFGGKGRFVIQTPKKGADSYGLTIKEFMAGGTLLDGLKATLTMGRRKAEATITAGTVTFANIPPDTTCVVAIGGVSIP